MGRKNIKLTACAAAIAALLLVALTNNPVSAYVERTAKAGGYMEYSPGEAYDLAHEICTQCHGVDRIKLYCPRCGPPFIAVVPHMQTFIENFRKAKPNLSFRNITESQAAAIVQVWNALVGNWEGDFREQDILKLIGHYEKLVELYKTPVRERSVEWALSGRDELKIGHMSHQMEMQKDLGQHGHDHTNR